MAIDEEGMMAFSRKLSEDAFQEIEAAMKAARTPGDLRRLLCVWLPAALALSRRQVARAVGWPVRRVIKVRERFHSRGASRLLEQRRSHLAPGSAEALTAALKLAGSVQEFQRIQCVLLPALFGLKGTQVAAAVGLRPKFVRKLQADYRRRGEAALKPGQGPPPCPEGAAEKLGAAMKHARTVAGLRRAQCLFMRIVLGLSTRVVARIVGWREDSVRHVRRHYLREGDAVLRNEGRGQARWRLLTHQQEAAVLRKLAQGPTECGFLMFPVIHKAFEEAAGCPLHPMVVFEILHRHGWTFAAVITTRRKGRGEGVEIGD